jgi:hypothetical protein
VKRALAVGWLALAACAAPAPRTLPPGADVWWFTISRDGSTLAYAERIGSNAWLVAGDRRYGPYP